MFVMKFLTIRLKNTNESVGCCGYEINVKSPAKSIELYLCLKIDRLVEILDSVTGKGLDNFSHCESMLRLCYAREKQVFQAFTPFGSEIQRDYPLFCARFTGLENRRAE